MPAAPEGMTRSCSDVRAVCGLGRKSGSMTHAKTGSRQCLCKTIAAQQPGGTQVASALTDFTNCRVAGPRRRR